LPLPPAEGQRHLQRRKLAPAGKLDRSRPDLVAEAAMQLSMAAPGPNGSKTPSPKKNASGPKKNIGVNHLLTFSAII
jgi:hypothetical protein